MKLREFTQSDWDGMAGCERFADGREPLVAYAVPTENPAEFWPGMTIDASPTADGRVWDGSVLVVVDARGLSIEAYTFDGATLGFQLNGTFTRELGETIARGLGPISRARLLALGFEIYTN